MSRTKLNQAGNEAEWDFTSFKTRNNPNRHQREEIDRAMDVANRFYDHALVHRLNSREYYGEYQRWIRLWDPDGELKPDFVDHRCQQDKIPKWRENLDYLDRIPVLDLRDVLLRLEQDFENWKQPRTKAEKYGKCEDFKKSVSYIGNFRNMHFDPDSSTIKLPFIEKYIGFGNIPENLPDGFRETKIIVAKEWDKYWFSVSYKYPKRPVEAPMTAVELDQGVANTVALSNGSDPKRFNMATVDQLHITELLKRKRHLQKSLSRKTGSKEGEEKSVNFMKVLNKIRDIDRKVANICKNHRHHISAKIHKEYGLVAIEKLEVKNLMALANSDLARRMATTSRGEMIRMFKQKMGEDRVVEVNPAKTSQTCCDYGEVSRKNRNGEKFRYRWCGCENHADTNASVNILESGMDSESGRFAGFLIMDQGRGVL